MPHEKLSVEWLRSTFRRLRGEVGSLPADALYSTHLLPGLTHRVGSDRNGNACVLFAVENGDMSPPVPLRLSHLDVDYAVRCVVWSESQRKELGDFVILRMRGVDEPELESVFGLVLASLAVLGPRPSRDELIGMVRALVDVLQRLREPARRIVSGLFAELLLLHLACDPVQAVRAWRVADIAKYDLVSGALRLDVKATTQGTRSHELSYHQCTPPLGTVGVIASVMLDEVGNGVSVSQLQDMLVERLGDNVEEALKVRQNVLATLGKGLQDSLAITYDLDSARASLRFFNAADVPAVRGPLPQGVSELRFRSQFDESHALSSARQLPVSEIDTAVLPRATDRCWS